MIDSSIMMISLSKYGAITSDCKFLDVGVRYVILKLVENSIACICGDYMATPSNFLMTATTVKSFINMLSLFWPIDTFLSIINLKLEWREFCNWLEIDISYEVCVYSYSTIFHKIWDYEKSYAKWYKLNEFQRNWTS